MSSDNSSNEPRKQEIIQEIQGLIERIAFKFKQRMNHPQSDYQLAGGQIFVIMMLNKMGSCNASDIANKLGVTSGAVTGLTDKLVNLGLMNRIRSEEDRRVVHFSLTEKGMELSKQIFQERMNKMMNVFSELKEEDLEKMMDVFTKLDAVLN
ncbi:MarR family transcriptional regulator [Paenibacillus sp. GP183]|uniref:MarR family winged helix-turn-helix transcriptional regulator n=1 Tax=Paenibacillus sp. GP183 TaxID=1882751 RepID=UPI000898EA9F|nr:MarR family transcriptional regulator [Paenibacillus sp. GP183]SEB78792.1 DNA-binding transcriptional regulator, MarR family [Paenibacillus sp. GP183]